MRTKGICSYRTYGKTVAFYVRKQYSDENIFISIRENTNVPARTKQWKETMDIAQSSDEIGVYGWIIVENEDHQKNIIQEIKLKKWLKTN